MKKTEIIDLVRKWKLDNDAKITFSTTERSANRYNAKGQKVKIFVSGEPDPSDLGIMPQPPYGSTKGDGSEDDKLWKVWNRTEVAIMKHFVDRALLFMARKFEGAEGAKAHYSRYAGCSSCPCSPGFVTDFVVPNNMWRQYYIHATVKTPARVRHEEF